MRHYVKLVLVILIIFFNSLIRSQTTDKIYFQLKSHEILNSDQWNVVNQNQRNIPLETFPFSTELSALFLSEIIQPFPMAVESPKLIRTFSARLNDITDLDRVLKVLNKLEEIEYAEPIFLENKEYVPDDFYFTHSGSWCFDNIQAEAAWDIHKGSSEIIVAIVDDAVELDHPDLQNIIWVNEGEIPGNLIDDDQNGFIDDINGWDMADWDNDPGPDVSSHDHGTHVSGIAGAETDNQIGVSSIGFGISIMALKGSSFAGNLVNTWDGVYYAALNGADIINCSWSSEHYSQTHEETVDWVCLEKGVIMVVAAGNYYNNLATSPRYPACYDPTICVANTNSNDIKVNSSNYGQCVDISAPGYQILSTIPSSTYSMNTGTSMSSPMVAGLLGLMKSYAPYATNEQLTNCLLTSADDINAVNPTYNGLLGSGRINALSSMNCLTSLMSDPVLSDFSLSEQTNCNGAIQFKDLSQGYINHWEWDFNGDGDIDDTTQNPIYVFSNSGTFDVNLTVSNIGSTDSEKKEDLVTFNLLDPPSISDKSICQGESVTLNGDNQSYMHWYYNENDMDEFQQGSNLILSGLISDTSFYVSIKDPVDSYHSVGITNFSGAGSNNNSLVDTYFDVHKTLNLKSVDVKCVGGFNRTIAILDSLDQTIFSKTFTFPSGTGTYTLDLDQTIFKGNNYRIGLPVIPVNFYRTTANVNYPYEISDLISITGSSDTANPNFYYYFYNWQVHELPCQSQRVQVKVNVDTACIGLSSLKETLIYPNPNQGQFTVRVPRDISGDITIYNDLGQTILEESFIAQPEVVNINLVGLSKGIYQLKLSASDETLVKKFVVVGD